jgi:hypothetical protein
MFLRGPRLRLTRSADLRVRNQRRRVDKAEPYDGAELATQSFIKVSFGHKSSCKRLARPFGGNHSESEDLTDSRSNGGCDGLLLSLEVFMLCY